MTNKVPSNKIPDWVVLAVLWLFLPVIGLTAWGWSSYQENNKKKNPEYVRYLEQVKQCEAKGDRYKAYGSGVNFVCDYIEDDEYYEKAKTQLDPRI